jgi:hypothetical protein
VIESATLEKKTNILSVIFGKALPSENGVVRKGELEMEIVRKGKPVAALKDAYPGTKVQLKKIEKKDVLVMNLKDLVQGNVFGGAFSSGPKMKLQLKIPSKIQGEILNAHKPQTEKLYENIKVKKQ